MTYVATYTVQDRVISISTDETVLLSSLLSNQTYIEVNSSDMTNNTNYYLDLNKIALYEPNINFSWSVATFIANIITDRVIEGYNTEIPVIDINTQRYDNRLNVYNALAAEDLCIDYTSITNLSVRNDPYLRTSLNDLALSSKTRDFTNSLVTVNGVFHPTQLFNNELYVLNGFSNIRNNDPSDKKIAIYDTTSLGGHTVIPLNLTQVVNNSSQSPTQGIYLKFNGTDFTNKTVLLSFGGYLYALDNSYEIIGTNLIKINTCKMDIISQWIHNPNTVYRNQHGSLAFNKYLYNKAEIDIPDPIHKPTPVQEILYFLNTQYPAITNTQKTAKTAFLYQYDYTPLYSYVTEIIDTLKYTDLDSDAFYYKILADPSSFLIVINNPNIYTRTYPLIPEFHPDQYTINSADMPRGILFSLDKCLPYTILSDSSHNRHIISTDFSQPFQDAYKTAFQPTRIPSPWFDTKNFSKNLPAYLLELYSP
jgi:hypothetical protein